MANHEENAIPEERFPSGDMHEITPRGKITVANHEENAIPEERFPSGDMEGNSSQGKDYLGSSWGERNPREKIPIGKNQGKQLTGETLPWQNQGRTQFTIGTWPPSVGGRVNLGEPGPPNSRGPFGATP